MKHFIILATLSLLFLHCTGKEEEPERQLKIYRQYEETLSKIKRAANEIQQENILEAHTQWMNSYFTDTLETSILFFHLKVKSIIKKPHISFANESYYLIEFEDANRLVYYARIEENEESDLEKVSNLKEGNKITLDAVFSNYEAPHLYELEKSNGRLEVYIIGVNIRQ